jgi:ketosteroid isomerase-like protein
MTKAEAEGSSTTTRTTTNRKPQEAEVTDPEIKTADITSATLGDMKVRVFGDTAVVTGTDDEITLKDGKKSIDHYVWTDVFVKRNGEWLGVASQTTQIK